MSDPRIGAQAVALSYKDKMVGKLYKHFKGYTYIVLDIAVHSEMAEPMVVYKGYTTNRDYTWVRPLSMFLSDVDHKKYPTVTQKKRFEPIDI